MQIAPNKTLDWEAQSVLRFSVIARDSPKSSLDAKTSSAMVVVDVLDVNDNAPKFVLDEYMGKKLFLKTNVFYKFY